MRSEARSEPDADLEQVSLALTVVLPDGAIQPPIPVEGELLLGRSPDCRVQIAHPSISRHHALFRVAPDGLTIEDLGSQNGTFVHGQAVSPGERVHVFANALIHVGAIEVRLRRAYQPRLPARVWPHAYIEGRVEEECARARRKNTAFALLRLSAPEAPPGACEQALDATMRAYDVLGLYATGEFEVVLIETSPEQAERAAARLAAALKHRGVEARLAVSCFPRDGGDAEEIFAHASNLLSDRPDQQIAAYEGQVAASPSMQSVLATAITVADSRLSVLILGETGVGKEVCAQLIHDRSPRAKGTFLKLHCAALPESLIESELFGHERGAFTGAVASKAGLIESAAGGTVFLDEIGELSLGTQAKLLRVFDAREVIRIGARQPRTVDVRFVAATNRHLEDEVAAGRFRQDLYFRLAGVVLQIPPLRERVGEIVLLARRFIEEICAQLGRTPPALSPAAVAELKAYPWPGNIRELRNAIERAVVLSEGRAIEPSHLPFEKFRTLARPRRPVPIVEPAPISEPPSTVSRIALQEEVATLQRRRVLDALAAAGGNQSAAARLLGMSRGALLGRLRAWGVSK